MLESCARQAAPSCEIDRSNLRPAEESFGIILCEIARMLYPPPNTAAQIASAVGCSVRNIELCLSGKQGWSGDAVAVLIGEICRRHHQRNVRIIRKK